jgi:hypothetical protein
LSFRSTHPDLRSPWAWGESNQSGLATPWIHEERSITRRPSSVGACLVEDRAFRDERQCESADGHLRCSAATLEVPVSETDHCPGTSLRTLARTRAAKSSVSGAPPMSTIAASSAVTSDCRGWAMVQSLPRDLVILVRVVTTFKVEGNSISLQGGRFHSRLRSLLHGADDAEKLRDSSW